MRESPAQFLDDLLSAQPVVIFSNHAMCERSIRAKQYVRDAIKSAGFDFAPWVIEVCTVSFLLTSALTCFPHFRITQLSYHGDSDLIRTYLMEKTGINSVPTVWVDGGCIGDLEETKIDYQYGILSVAINAAVNKNHGFRNALR